MELSEQLQSSFVIFSHDVLPTQCRIVKTSIYEKCVPVCAFLLRLRQMDNLPLEIVARDIWLRKELVGFDREAKALGTMLDHFEEVEAMLLRQSQKKREEVQHKISKLRERCVSLLATLKELQYTKEKS